MSDRTNRLSPRHAELRASITSAKSALECSATALAAVTAERDALLDRAEIIAHSHPHMVREDVIGLVLETAIFD